LREVEKFFFRSERPSTVLLFKVHLKKKELARKAVLDKIRISKKHTFVFFSPL